MRILLDTHALVFSIARVDQLGRRIRELLEDSAVERWVSPVSLNEIAIKVNLGKLPFPLEREFYVHHLSELRAKVLPLDLRHSLAVLGLPPHHKDPFDRLLIAQAREEGLTLATRDPIFARYEVQIVW